MLLRLQHFLRELRVNWPLMLLVLAVGCGTATFVVQQYDGDPLPEQRIAIVRLNGDQALRLEELDGEVLGYELRDNGTRVHIEILPGEHELALAEGAGKPLKRRRFIAEAGRVYRPMLIRTRLERNAIPGVDWTIGIYEVDRNSDEVLREISQLPPTPRVTSVAPNPIPSIAPPSTPSVAPLPEPPSSTATPPSAVPTHSAPVPATPDPAPSERLPSTVHSAVSPPHILAPSLDGSPPAKPQPGPVPSGVAPAVGPDPTPIPDPATPL